MGLLTELGFILQFTDLVLDKIKKKAKPVPTIDQAVQGLLEGIKKGSSLSVKATDERYNQLKAELLLVPPKVSIKRVTDIDDRVRYIKDMIIRYGNDPKVRRLATSILSERCGLDWCVREKDWEGEVRQIFNTVRRNVRYVRDIYRRDTFTSPLRTFLEYKAGDCDDYTILLGSLLFSIGYPVKLKVVQTKPNKTWNHIYLLVGLPPVRPTKWVSLDASQPYPMGWEVPKNIVIKQKVYDVL